jgi:hypothetical protein
MALWVYISNNYRRWCSDFWAMNWKGWVTKRSWSNEDIILTLCKANEENQEGKHVPWPRFEHGISQILVQIVSYLGCPFLRSLSLSISSSISALLLHFLRKYALKVFLCCEREARGILCSIMRVSAGKVISHWGVEELNVEYGAMVEWYRHGKSNHSE